MAYVDSAPKNSGGISSQTFSGLGSGVSDIFSGFGDISKMQGAEAEAQQYTEAAQLARQQAQYTQMSTAIQQAQEARTLSSSLGRTQAQVAGAGFAASGSALDILRSSAQQGALQQAATGYQGQIQEAALNEQATAYTQMASAEENAAKSDNLASIGSFIAGGLQIAGAMAMI